VGAPNFGLISIPLAVKFRSLRSAILAILVIASFGDGSEWAEEDEGRLDFGIEAILEKLFGWSGAKFHASVINNHGDGLSREYLGNNLMTVSSIEALNHTRLDEFWIEQASAHVSACHVRAPAPTIRKILIRTG
jgi:hypothetical protein